MGTRSLRSRKRMRVLEARVQRGRAAFRRLMSADFAPLSFLTPRELYEPCEVTARYTQLFWDYSLCPSGM